MSMQFETAHAACHAPHHRMQRFEQPPMDADDLDAELDDRFGRLAKLLKAHSSAIDTAHNQGDDPHDLKQLADNGATYLRLFDAFLEEMERA